MRQEQQERDSSQLPPRDLLPRLLPDWSLHPALQADLQLAVALKPAPGRALPVALVPPVAPAVVVAVLVLDL
jgi:hypothetical protein